MNKILLLLIVIFCIIIITITGYMILSYTTIAPTKDASEIGTRGNPVAVGKPLIFHVHDNNSNVDYWCSLTLLRVLRGEDALEKIQLTQIVGVNPEKDKEFLVANFRFEKLNTTNANAACSISPSDFEILSKNEIGPCNQEDQRVRPELQGELYRPDAVEGWASFCVRQNDSKPLIAYNGKFWFDVSLENALTPASTPVPPALKTVKTGDYVSIDYTGSFDSGYIFETTNALVAQQAGIFKSDMPYTPVSLVVGSGTYADVFENSLIGMRIGETKSFVVPPVHDFNPLLIKPVKMSDLIAAGITPRDWDIVYYHFQPVTIMSIPDNNTVMVDFNDPLAGKTAHYAVTVRSINGIAIT